MTRSMRSRSRFNEPPPPQRHPDEEEGGRKKSATILGQIVLFILIGILGYMAYDWQVHDISGEYQAVTKQLGVVRLSLLRKATTINGDIMYGRGSVLAMTTGSYTGERHLQMSFAVPQDLLNQGFPQEYASLDGDLVNGTFKGTIEAGGRTLDVTLSKNSLASFYRGLQAHLPWAN